MGSGAKNVGPDVAAYYEERTVALTNKVPAKVLTGIPRKKTKKAESALLGQDYAKELVYAILRG